MSGVRPAGVIGSALSAGGGFPPDSAPITLSSPKKKGERRTKPVATSSPFTGNSLRRRTSSVDALRHNDSALRHSHRAWRGHRPGAVG